jgi:uncharacterized membrane protein YkoI
MMKLRWSLGLMVVCATLALAAFAAEKEQAKPKWTGSIRVQGKHTQTRLKQMAKITAQEAARAALAAVPGNPEDKKVQETELEVEHGFLIYEVEVRVKGQKGEREVIVDAGSGKVLAQDIEDDDDDDDDDDEDDDDGDDD